jgi:hypothetical protein
VQTSRRTGARAERCDHANSWFSLRFEHLRHDITFPLHVAFDENQKSRLSGLVDPPSAQSQTTKTSVHGAINIVELAKRAKGRVMRLRHVRTIVVDRGALIRELPA